MAQRDLAEPGTSYGYISRIEAGKRNPSLEALIALARKLDTTALYLLTGHKHALCPLCQRSGATDQNGAIPAEVGSRISEVIS